MKRRLLFFLFLLAAGMPVFGQLPGWSYKSLVEAIETDSVSHTNYQVRYIFDSQALISAGKLQSNGGDLRFGDACGTATYPYWIESGLNTTQTEVWILLPSVPANTTTSFYMYYGNASAPDGNDFAGTFPAAIRTNGGNLFLTGSMTADFVWVEANDTIHITAGAAGLTITGARKFRVDATGFVNGIGRGNLGVSTNFTVGTGPGGGNPSVPLNSGSGGGSYGGVGGTGGYDAGDTPGIGGAAYGTADGTDCQAGSAGGSGGAGGFSGSGGSALDVTAEYMQIDGTIDMTGTVGGSAGQCGGGGSGGCIKLVGGAGTGTGTLKAAGGPGGPGTSTANDSGGGGGGGRIKAFSQAAWTGTVTMNVAGGIGGPNGTAGIGQNGGIGTDTMIIALFAGDNPTMQSGSEMAATALGINANDTTVCPGANYTIFATSGNYSYQWSTGDTSASTTVTGGATYTVTITAASGCTAIDSIVVTEVTTNPLTISGNGFACAGSCDTLTASAGFSSYLWNTGATTASIQACATGTYDVTVNDPSGCVLTETFAVTVDAPIIFNSTPVTACTGSPTVIDASGNYASWLWSTGETTPTITVTTSGTYSVTITSMQGCTGGGSVAVTYVPLPTPSVTANGNQLSVSPSYPSMQWLLNGTPIPGATGATYTATTTGNYSISVVDANGCTNTSTDVNVVVGMADLMSLSAGIYPNPTKDAATLVLSLAASQSLRLSILDAVGKVVWQANAEFAAGETRYALPSASLPTGVYMLQLNDGERQQTLRFVRQ